MGDVENCELQASRHQRCPGVPWKVGMAVDVKVLGGIMIMVRVRMTNHGHCCDGYEDYAYGQTHGDVGNEIMPMMTIIMNLKMGKQRRRSW